MPCSDSMCVQEGTRPQDNWHICLDIRAPSLDWYVLLPRRSADFHKRLFSLDVIVSIGALRAANDLSANFRPGVLPCCARNAPHVDTRQDPLMITSPEVLLIPCMKMLQDFYQSVGDLCSSSNLVR
jgi:hypothetical protein